MKLLPQEITVWYLLPGLRKELASVLKKKGKANSEIAKLLQVTPSAVSQYFKHKRGNHIDDEDLNDEINAAADQLINGKVLITVMNQLLQKAKEKGKLCDLCKKIDPSVPHDCNYC